MHRYLTILLFCLALVAAACGEGEGGAGDEPGDEEWPDRLVIGLVPSREADVLVENARPLADALAEALDIEVESFVPTDYTGLIEAMGAGQADIGMFGPLALVRAEERYGVEIVLQAVRFGSLTYVTQWFTNDPDTFCLDEPVADEDGFLYCNGVLDAESGPVGDEALANVAGKTVAFVDAASASGYLIPALQLIQNDLDPNEDINGIFAGGHDNSVISVYNGDADVGVSFNDARGNVLEELPDVGEKVVVFAWSRDIPNDGAAVRSELPESLKDAIVDAYIDFASTEEGKEVLGSIYNIDDVQPADPAAFDVIRDAERELGDSFDG